MDFPKTLMQYEWDNPFCVLRGHRSKLHNFDILKIVLISANSADPDEILPCAAFHCLPKYLFSSIQNEKG